MPEYYHSIAYVSESVVELLRSNMKDILEDKMIELVSPGEVSKDDDVRLSVFLYGVSESPHNSGGKRIAVGVKAQKEPPMLIDIFYMLTAYPAEKMADRMEKKKDQYAVLGRAMQVLHERSTLKGPDLKGRLPEVVDKLHITPVTVSIDDMTKIWGTFHERPFIPSICYVVSSVPVPCSEDIPASRVGELTIDVHLPGR